LHSTGPLLFGFSLLSPEAANESERQEHFSAGVIFGISLNRNFATEAQTDAVLDQTFVTPLDVTEYLG
jgi:hypothetical protein